MKLGQFNRNSGPDMQQKSEKYIKILNESCQLNLIQLISVQTPRQICREAESVKDKESARDR